VESYQWDPSGRLVAILQMVSGEWQVQKSFAWSGSNLTAVMDPGGRIVMRYVYLPGSRVPQYLLLPQFSLYNNANPVPRVFKYIADHLGSARLLVEISDGAIADRMEYDAIGRKTYKYYRDFQPFGFAGGFTLLGPNLVRFGARDYDPETGRWTSKDPIGFGGGDTSLYGYVLGDPINWTDFSGSAQFGMRPLDGVPVAIGEEGSPADQDNLEIAHEQLFFDDQTSPDNLGFFNDGEVRPDNPKKHEKSDYEMRDPVYDDKIMRDAVKNVNAGEYDVLSNNCQDWADAVRREYERLKKLEKEKEKDKKRLVCPKS